VGTQYIKPLVLASTSGTTQEESSALLCIIACSTATLYRFIREQLKFALILKHSTDNSCVPVRAIYSATATATIIFSVLWIRDVYPGSRILIFTHPGSWISDPESKNRNKREG
jgi:hypothetical protein